MADSEAGVQLPRLAVVVDFGVQRTSGGQLLLYRLLADYPRDRLRVVYDPSQVPGDANTFLPGVQYHPCPLRIPRWIRNRLNPFWPVLASVWARTQQRRVGRLLGDFRPDAILTVPHWYLWFAADSLARSLRVPLHLIVHDDWPSYTTFRRAGVVSDWVRGGCRAAMRPVYQRASSRLVISPGMNDLYRQWFGAPGAVLYPSRGDDSPPARVRVRPTPDAAPVVAFCGGIHLGGVADLLRRLAVGLGACGGRLDLYTTSGPDHLRALGIEQPNVRHCGFLPSAEMGERLGRSAHVLFLPASFDPRERVDVSTLFPSKLADYTAVGLPVLVWGPAYSSAARWAVQNPGAAILVSDPDVSHVVAAAVAVAGDPDRALSVATTGAAAGSRDFDLRNARRTLVSSLLTGHRVAGAGTCANSWERSRTAPPPVSDTRVGAEGRDDR
jgi:hypothetical protein